MKINPFRMARSVPALAVATRTDGTVNGLTVDRHLGGTDDYRGGVLFTVHTGTITDGAVAIAVQDSDDGAVWVAAAAEVVQGATAIAATDDNTVLECGYSGTKRYCRVSFTTTGATTGGSFGATAVMFQGRRNKR